MTPADRTGRMPHAPHWAATIDWTAPWLAPLRAVGEPIARAAQAGQPLCEALNDAHAVLAPAPTPGAEAIDIQPSRAAPVQFVPHGDLPPRVAYETHVFHTRRCPTRDGLHDFFNALVWLHHPAVKQRLNALQAQAIAAAGGTSGPRGPLRDAITLFDENGAVLLAPEPLWDALLARDWQRLFVAQRAQWGQSQLHLFGHALMEQLCQPRKPITAHVWVWPQARLMPSGSDGLLPRTPDLIATQLDPAGAWGTFLLNGLTADDLRCKPFTPLPVLGVPGWWAANETPDFYADTAVFRPPAPAGRQGLKPA